MHDTMWRIFSLHTYSISRLIDPSVTTSRDYKSDTFMCHLVMSYVLMLEIGVVINDSDEASHVYVLLHNTRSHGNRGYYKWVKKGGEVATSNKAGLNTR